MTCSNTYCHGYLNSGNLDNTVGWTGPDAAACGTCHGDPSRPTLHEKALPRIIAEGGAHIPVPVGTYCSNCHGGTVDSTLNIINPSKHIDGKLNLFGNDVNF
jgi:predicted CxxxxCH...CXXCH cytochrome family protein